MRLEALVIITLLMVSLSGCAEKKEIGKLEVVIDFSEFPKKYTLDGENISPEIEIHGISENAKSLVIILDDPDAPDKTFATELLKAIQGRNDFGRIGYDGPYPPKGEVHRYFFRVYALDSMLNLPPGAERDELENAMKGHVIQYGEAVATYGR